MSHYEGRIEWALIEAFNVYRRREGESTVEVKEPYQALQVSTIDMAR